MGRLSAVTVSAGEEPTQSILLNTAKDLSKRGGEGERERERGEA